MKSPTSILTRVVGALAALTVAVSAFAQFEPSKYSVVGVFNGYNSSTHSTSWTYTVTSADKYAISHWLLLSCNLGSAGITGSAGQTLSYGKDGSTDYTGLKFAPGLTSSDTVNTTAGTYMRVVTLTMTGNWSSGPLSYLIKPGNTNGPNADASYLTGTTVGPVPNADGECKPNAGPPPLTVTCPANQVVSAPCGADGVSISLQPVANGGTAPYSSSATFSNPDIVYDPSTGNYFFPLGSTTTVWIEATDAGTPQQKAKCSYTVTVNAPTSCSTPPPPPRRRLNNTASAGNTGGCGTVTFSGVDLFTAGTLASFGQITYTNLPGIGSVTVGATDPVMASFPYLSTTTVGYTAYSGAAGSSSIVSAGTFSVAIADSASPVFTSVPGAKTVVASASCAATVNLTSGVLVSDCDPNPTVVYSENGVTITNPTAASLGLGSHTITITATDQTGKTTSATISVTVEDKTAPVITEISNVRVNNDPTKCGAIVNFTLAATDCNGPVTVTSLPASGSEFPVGTTTVIITAKDAADNTSTSSFTVTVTDNEKPTVDSVANISVSTEAGQCDAAVTFAISGSDNCPGVTTTASPASGSRFSKGTTTVTVTSTDTAGNSAFTTFTVTVKDDEKPVVGAQGDIIVSTEAGQCDAAVTFNVSGTDNCSLVTVTSSVASGSRFAKGTTIVTITATDADGNVSTRTFTVTVNDAEKPKIFGVGDITVSTGAGSTVCSALASYGATATDNCAGTVNLLYSIASGSSFPVGSTNVTVTATDAAGNSASVTFAVTVVDNTPPALTLIAPTIAYTQGVCGAVVSFSDTAKDNCKGSVAVSYDLSAGHFTPGTYTVNATATDGTSSTTTPFTFTVANNTGLIIGNVFFDLNPNGVQDAGEVAAGGMTVTVSGPATGSAVTAANGSYSISGLVPGTYVVTVTAASGWVITTPVANRTVAIGGTNLCTGTANVGAIKYGAGGGLSKGFWTNKNGESVFGGANSAGNLAALVAANLFDGKGVAFNPTSYAQVKTFLNNATATNMAYMLSAQLTAVILDIQSANQAPGAKFGLDCTGADLLYVGNLAGATGLYPTGFVQISTVIADANTALAELGGGNTTLSSSLRTRQDILKTILDGVCNNTNFVMAP